MGNRDSAQTVKAENRKAARAQAARVGDASCEIWIEGGRHYVYLIAIHSTIIKRKPKTKWRYSWAVEQHKRHDEEAEPLTIAYAETPTFQAAFRKAGAIVARKLSL